LITMLGMEPPAVKAGNFEAPYRFAVVTPKDDPQVIKVSRPGRRTHYRKISAPRAKKIVWRYV